MPGTMSEEKTDTALTMAKLNLQWLINKHKNSDEDYSHRIQFARFNLERISGQKVKLNIKE